MLIANLIGYNIDYTNKTAKKPMDKLTYQGSGVDISLADKFVNYIASVNPKNQNTWPTNANYASVYPISENLGLCLTTDGVGSKVLIASQLNNYDNIGLDLVAMCVNDLLCVGAVPTLFLDYYAFSQFDYTTACKIIDSIIKGCKLAKCSLVGGETAQMPDLYQANHFDLAGFALGTVDKRNFIDGSRIAPGNTIIGLTSNGIHSNGLSLARKIIPENSPLYAELLDPTFIYVEPILNVLNHHADSITGICHVTGGGITNLFRLHADYGYKLDLTRDLSSLYKFLADKVEAQELFKTFNMGYGMYVIVNSSAQEICASINKSGFLAHIVGEITSQANTIEIYDKALSPQNIKITR